MCNAFAQRYSNRFSLGSLLSNMLSLITSIFPILAPLCSRAVGVKSPALKFVDGNLVAAVEGSDSAACDKLKTAMVAANANPVSVDRDASDGIYSLSVAVVETWAAHPGAKGLASKSSSR